MAWKLGSKEPHWSLLRDSEAASLPIFLWSKTCFGPSHFPEARFAVVLAMEVQWGEAWGRLLCKMTALSGAKRRMTC